MDSSILIYPGHALYIIFLRYKFIFPTPHRVYAEPPPQIIPMARFSAAAVNQVVAVPAAEEEAHRIRSPVDNSNL